MCGGMGCSSTVSLTPSARAYCSAKQQTGMIQSVLMSVLNPRLKCIVTDALDAHTFELLGCLHAEVP